MDERLSDDRLRDENLDDCTRVMSVMFSFLDRELPEPECDEVRLHLFACDDCNDQYQHYTVVRAVVRRCCAPVEVPAGLRARLIARIRNNPPSQ